MLEIDLDTSRTVIPSCVLGSRTKFQTVFNGCMILGLKPKKLRRSTIFGGIGSTLW